MEGDRFSRCRIALVKKSFTVRPHVRVDVPPNEREQMPYTLGEAAQAVGKAKSTIFKAIKDGVISSSRDERGRFVIEPAELHRVFPPVAPVIAAERSPEQPAEQTCTDAGALTATLECG